MRAFAEKTSVPIERSRAEIEGILRRHGATAFGHRWNEEMAMKAKFESIAAGISEFEEEFLAYVVDPGSRQTVYELMKPQIKERYLGNSAGQLLLAGPPATTPG